MPRSANVCPRNRVRYSNNNPGLFQFDLKVATFTRTWTKQESVPWAEGSDGSTG